jgi:hypothetical protein
MVSAVFLLSGCLKQFIPDDDVARFGTDRKFPDLNYAGDGTFTDHGRKAAIHRFVLDLGELDLKEASAQIHELKGLPEVNFVCYMRVDHPLPLPGKPNDFKAGDLVVEMSLRDQAGKEVFAEKTPLSRWVWSGTVGAPKSDLYTRKTMFTPEKGKSYKISLKLGKGNLEAPKGRFLLMGGGWKVP